MRLRQLVNNLLHVPQTVPPDSLISSALPDLVDWSDEDPINLLSDRERKSVRSVLDQGRH
jgi:hypothetical protein